MAKFYGKVGFAMPATESPVGSGIYVETVTERNYSGDVLQNNMRWQQGQAIVDDIKISNRISLVADTFARNNSQYIRYLIWKGIKWKVSYIDESNPPRIIATLGGEYNQ